MRISDLIPEAKNLTKLGVRKHKPDPAAAFFTLPRERNKLHLPIKPDVDYHPEAEREPQAPHYTQMWLDHWDNWGNIHNPVGSPME